MRFAICLVSLWLLLGAISWIPSSNSDQTSSSSNTPIQLGNFSISLKVKDLQTSKAFYEALGFVVSGGNAKQNYLIMQNSTSTIGLFQGMLEKNSLTYNPGWDRDCKTLPEFQDVREIQQELKKRGLTPTVLADETSKGPAFMVLTDPDGNPILIDQHVAKPAK